MRLLLKTNPTSWTFHFWKVCFLVCAWFLGTAHSGRAAEGAKLWSYRTLSTALSGAVVAPPAVGPDGTVYIGTEIGASNSLYASGQLFAIGSDGRQKWNFTTADWIDAAPLVTQEGDLVFGTWAGRLHCLTSSGTQKWQYSTGSYIVSSAAQGQDGTLYVGSGDGVLHALYPDGRLRWTYLTGDSIESSPAVGPDGTLYFGSMDNALYALSPEGGLRWSQATEGDISASPALAADGTVYIGSMDGKLYAYTADGNKKWSFDTGDSVSASPVIGAGGTVYVASTAGRIFALSPQGVELWRYPLEGQAALQALFSTPAVRADGSLVFGASEAAVYCLNGNGTLRWKTTVGDWVDSSPVLAPDGTIYVGSYDKILYALDGGGVRPSYGDWGQFHRDPQKQGWQPLGIAGQGGGRFLGLSVRAKPGTGSGELVVGCGLEGAGERQLLVRAVGPTLKDYGIASAMPDPSLTVFRGTTPYLSNDNWNEQSRPDLVAAAAASVYDFPLPTGSKDAALLGAFSEGVFTAYPLLPGRTNGVSLLEVYDLGGAATARLVSLSTRNQVGTGENILVAGFSIQGGPMRLVLQGIGPALAKYLEGTLLNPLLRLYRGSQLIAENDEWGQSSNAAQLASKAQEARALTLEVGSRDAALAVTLEPGLYSAELRGVNDTEGAGMIEIYELK